MSGTHWAAIVGTAGGIIGTGVGGASAVIAGLAKRHARESAEEAAELRRIEGDRQHEALKPMAPAKIETELRNETLWGTITVHDRDYQAKAVGIYSTGGEHLLEASYLLRANQTHEFPIEPWPHGTTKPKTQQIRFSFWPPTDGAWHCRCGRPEDEEANKDGHWQLVVPVSYYDVTQSVW